MIPVLGHIIRPGLGESILTGAHRVLSVKRLAEAVWLILLTEDNCRNVEKRRYCPGPKCYPLSLISEALERGALIMEEVSLPGLWQMTDADYLKNAPNDRERKLRSKRLESRDFRWRAVHAVVGDQLAQDLVPTTQRLADSVRSTAKLYKRSVPTIYSWVHRYWAGGECLNSLLPHTNLCGGPGKRKPYSPRRKGRKSRLYKAGLAQSEGYVPQDIDRERLAAGYALVKPGVTMHDAYLLTMGAYWSETNQDETGSLKRRLLPESLRPTEVQFAYWGRALHGTPLRRKIAGLENWQTSTLALAGSAQDQVHAVGQMAMIDSTSSDVYLTSALSRHKILPPMRRTIVVDVRSTAVMGFYMGWEPVSSITSLQAILCASEDKTEVAARFGVKINQDDWPGMLHRLYLADNGEMKSEALQKAERNFHFGIEYAKSGSGQSKSLVENQHHTDHKAFDHKLPGTTRGRKAGRGESNPANAALWNYHEYMHEYILAVLEFNSEEVPHLAPFEMRKEGLSPTRINIFRWMRDHGMRADISFDVGQLRAYLLTERRAVMKRDGIHLLMDDGIRRLPGHRFFCGELTSLHSWQSAVERGKAIGLLVKLNPQDLSRVWLATDTGLLAVPNVEAEQALLEEMTLTDCVMDIQDKDLRLDSKREKVDQRGLDTIIRRLQITKGAKREKKEQAKGAVNASVCGSSRKQSLKANARKEIALINQPPSLDPVGSQTVCAPAPHDAIDDAADRAMRDFMKSLDR
ncbi:hypothetical protein [Dyella ginsengisoli]|uniref:hypothetical protein n=1 Tax=Dyella ginsengisoli TaxID=363848 RepID=UPI00034B3D22|nr:hypothetical protein [Dyella ginsengisoli]